MPGERTVSPAGSVTTGTSGVALPPVPRNSRAICWLVSHPSLPGTENFCLSAFVAEPAEAIPTRVTTSQNPTTMRLCASTQRVILSISAPEGRGGRNASP